jgi:hypothetical protein
MNRLLVAEYQPSNNLVACKPDEFHGINVVRLAKTALQKGYREALGNA